jgi:hypothetical protein
MTITTDIRIGYEGMAFASTAQIEIDVERGLRDSGLNPIRVCDMFSHLTITVATADLAATVDALEDMAII